MGPGGEELPPTLSDKVRNAVDALVRSVADVRGRNAEELSQTVTDAKTFTAIEAAELGVVDYVADDLSHLLELVHGEEVVLRTATGADARRQLQTQGITVRRSDMTLVERLLDFLADPNVSFILISIGGLGIVIELFNPGMFVPVVVGVICLVLRLPQHRRTTRQLGRRCPHTSRDGLAHRRTTSCRIRRLGYRGHSRLRARRSHPLLRP